MSFFPTDDPRAAVSQFIGVPPGVKAFRDPARAGLERNF